MKQEVCMENDKIKQVWENNKNRLLEYIDDQITDLFNDLELIDLDAEELDELYLYFIAKIKEELK